jgi:hypothetical protein
MHLTNYRVNMRSNQYVCNNCDESLSTTGNQGCKRSIQWSSCGCGHSGGRPPRLSCDQRLATSARLQSQVPSPSTRKSIQPYTRGGPDNDAANNDAKQGSGSLAEPSVGGGSHAAVTTTTTNNINDNATAFFRKSRCFKLLGYNIMVGSNLRPILIKVNHLLSWGTDTSLNQDVKFHAIMQALRVINVNRWDKKSFKCARQRRSLAPFAVARRRGSSAGGGFPSDDNTAIGSVLCPTRLVSVKQGIAKWRSLRP